MSKNMRSEMPVVAAFIDSLRKAFGQEMIDQQIRKGMRGAPTFYAKENGHELGTQSPLPAASIARDAKGIAYVMSPSTAPTKSTRSTINKEKP